MRSVLPGSDGWTGERYRIRVAEEARGSSGPWFAVPSDAPLPSSGRVPNARGCIRAQHQAPSS